MSFTIIKKALGDNVILEVSPPVDWQDFDRFCDWYLQHEGAELVSKDLGMDRHQVRYRVGEKQFILQFEHYTESIWIEQDF
jgi:hypothetical protein